MNKMDFPSQFNHHLLKHGIPLQCPSPGIRGDGNCYFGATHRIMQEPAIKESLDPQMQLIKDPEVLRAQVIYFIKTSHELQISVEFQALRAAVAKTEAEWDAYLEQIQDPSKWADEPLIYATALFLKKDVFLFQLEIEPNDARSPWLRISGSFTGDLEASLPITLGYKKNVHFEALLPAPNKPINGTCFCCGWSGAFVKHHLSRIQKNEEKGNVKLKESFLQILLL